MNAKIIAKLGPTAFMSRSIVKVNDDTILPALTIKVGVNPIDYSCQKEIAFNIFTKTLEKDVDVKPYRQGLIDILAKNPTGKIESASDALAFYCKELAKCEDVRKISAGEFNGTFAKWKELPVGEYITSTPVYSEFVWADPSTGQSKIIKSYKLRTINIETGEAFITDASLTSFVGTAIANQPKLAASLICYLQIAKKEDKIAKDGSSKTYVSGSFRSSISTGMALAKRQNPITAAQSIHESVAQILNGQIVMPSVTLSIESSDETQPD